MDSDSVSQAIESLLFGVRRSVRYHNRRRMFFDRWRVTTSAISVVFGSAAIVSISGMSNTRIATFSAVIVTLFSAVDLVVGTAKAARDHADLARRFISLEQEINNSPAIDQESLIRLTNTRLDIEKDEPPVLRVLDTLCHNEMLRSMGFGKEKFIKVGLFQRIFSQFFDFREDSLRSST
ncbi:MAG: hypothetical protein HQL77_15435 [Magnetococcales bacterium]|nr:hypothetical protein [Magnetococcales bacterium]